MDHTKKSYFSLSDRSKKDLLDSGLTDTGQAASVLEKDIWVCLVLHTLFAMPDRHDMVFKGGTSLSKVYNAIHRFSEDIDVTVNWVQLGTTYSPDTINTLSNTQRRKAAEAILTKLQHYVEHKILPYLTEALAQYPGVTVTFELSADATPLKDKLRVHYPTVFNDLTHSAYRPTSVLLEFGAKNPIDPNSPHSVTSYLAEFIPEVDFPVATIDVLSIERTFWEKATLLHDESHRPGGVKATAHRLSRHWYDLARLSTGEHKDSALAAMSCLENVVSAKTTFFSNSFSEYDKCLQGQFVLIPAEASIATLRADYQAMVDNNFFYEEVIPFDSILTAVKNIEIEINAVVLEHMNQKAAEATT